ncbi:MAG TPA: NAD-dependent epimerase/dehydratase family protein [Candidatus Dormibacteraeota bacterium]|nr:NAD-dependent epimerase/dehydratase family protein [Candidatus Dormibacteraeota bacterium]
MSRVLVTGGAGFIGSHLVRRLRDEGDEVRVLDNFATGRQSNLEQVDGVEVHEGDIRSPDDVNAAMRGMEGVFHLAALPSVARSWKDPVATLATNAHGTANLVEAAARSGVSAFVYSSSSSIYGDQAAEKKSEAMHPKPISPYGYSKLLGEMIALAHARAPEGMRVVALRYFNVFGPRQDPDSPYAAVIPLFITHALAGTTATVDGDGTQSRDFTYVDNVVDANVCAYRSSASGVAMNVACGSSHTLLELVDAISALNGRPMRMVFGPPRQGDIKHSLADISLAAAQIGYQPRISFQDGLRKAFDEYRSA